MMISEARGTKPSAENEAGRLGIANLRRLFSEFLQHEPAVRDQQDADAVHDMRVAGRRLRAALRFFESVLPPGLMRLHDEFGWAGDALGTVRDLDIQIEALAGLQKDATWEDQAAINDLLRVMRKERATAQEGLREALAGPRYESLVRDMASALYGGPLDSEASHLAPRSMAPQLRRRYRSFRRQAARLRPDSPTTEFHAVRRRAKRLRYDVEFLAPFYHRPAERFLAAMTEVQDLLGEHQDAIVTIEHFRSLTQQHASELAPPTLLFMGRLSERNRRAAKKLRRRWPRSFEALRESWRPLGKALRDEG